MSESPERERESIAELHAAWRALRPDGARPADPLDDAAVARVRAAWRRLDAPHVNAPLSRAATTRAGELAPRFAPTDAARVVDAVRASRVRRIGELARWAIAAGIAGVALYGAWKAARASRTRMAPVAEPAVASDVESAGDASREPRDATPRAPREKPRSIPIVARTPSSIELRSGNVRLTWITNARADARAGNTSLKQETHR